MTRLFRLCVALALSALLAPRPAACGKDGGYIDILSAQVGGELRSQTYDVYRLNDGAKQFVGNTEIAKGTFVGGGFGLRLIYGHRNGLHVSGESSIAIGRMSGATLPWLATSLVTRATGLAGLGYQRVLGPFVLHTAGIIGIDYTAFRVAQPVSTTVSSTAALSSSTLDPYTSPSPDSLRLDRMGLRLGIQAGAHFQVAKVFALFGDVTFDYDGQWRSQFGIALGQPPRR